jgi:hypothetical protein
LEPKSDQVNNQVEDQRESFRIEDSLSFMVYTLEGRESSPSDEAVGDLEGLLKAALPYKDIDPLIWKLLIHIDKKLDLILERLPIDLMKIEPRPVNLSADGMRIKVRKKYDLTEKVKIKMLLPDLPPKEVIATGTVVRIVPVGEGVYELALHFSDLNEEVREEIVQHALKQQRKSLSVQKQKRGLDELNQG